MKTDGVRDRAIKLRRALSDGAKITLIKLKDAVFPENITCDACGGELVADTRYRLCAGCGEDMPFIKDKICLVCGAPIRNEADYCNRCRNTESVFKYNRSALSYDKGAKKLILSLKYGKKRYIAATLGAMMADTYLKMRMDGEIIVPVPMSESELKARGFNQSELLAEEIGKRLDIPVLPALVKNRDTAAQKNLGRKEREKNLSGAFACVFKEVYGRKILLVDDVFTTGATANECARVLLKARAKEVSVLTAAVTELKLVSEGGVKPDMPDENKKRKRFLSLIAKRSH